MKGKIGRALVAIGVSIIWLPFAALAGLAVLASQSGPGLPATDWPIALISFAIVGTLPILTWRALRAVGFAPVVMLALVGVAVAVLWASLLRPDYSAPLHWIGWLTILGGSVTAGGSVLMIAGQPSRPAPPATTE